MARRLALCMLAVLAATLVGCGGDVTDAVETPQAPVAGPTGIRIRPVPGVPTLATGPVDAQGHQARVACSTCHSMKTPDRTQRGGKGLATFHQGLELAHGSLTCLSCHNEGDYDTLRLANGASVRFEDVRQLCAQCHATQARDYEHGVHGGMSGYWDTTRGEQVRNQCTHCHAPHAPAFPVMQPTFKPRDRFLPAAPEPTDD